MKYFLTRYIISNVSNIIIPQNQNKCLSWLGSVFVGHWETDSGNHGSIQTLDQNA